MKNSLLLTLLLFLSLQGFAQDSVKLDSNLSPYKYGEFKISGWHQSDGITYMQVRFDCGWAVFQLQGDHLNKPDEMIHGCILTKRWGLYLFYPVPGLGYVKAGDEEKIKQALGVKVLCNGDVDKINALGY